MRNIGVFFILVLALSGCFKEEPQLPQVYAKQQYDVTIDSLSCASGYETFENFEVFCSEPYDAITWYLYVGIGSPTWVEWSTNDTLLLTAAPNHGYIIRADISVKAGIESHFLTISYCANQMYIPEAFTPNDQDAINDTWYPVYYNTWDNVSNLPDYSIHWEIRTLDGQKIYESNETLTSDHGWDGRFNGYQMPYGTYLYYIELTISGEDPIEYTGSIEMLG